MTGRFINADVYADTGSGSPLSTNMFAYCENNPLYKTDSNGKDAAWIQSPSSVAGQGHTSLLIRESSDCWWYLYWGNNSVYMMFLPASNLEQLNTRIKRTLNVFNLLYGKRISFDDKYEKSLLFRGNFVSCIKAFRNKLYVAQKLSKTGYLSLTFNPAITTKEYNAMIKNLATVKKNLKKSLHVYHHGKQRPASLFMVGKNVKYSLFGYNCMDLSMEILAYGSLSTYCLTSNFRDDLYYTQKNILDLMLHIVFFVG